MIPGQGRCRPVCISRVASFVHAVRVVAVALTGSMLGYHVRLTSTRYNNEVAPATVSGRRGDQRDFDTARRARRGARGRRRHPDAGGGRGRVVATPIPESRFVEIFTADKPVVFAFHGCQRALHASCTAVREQSGFTSAASTSRARR
jgi:hypothetical protein